MTRPAKSSLVLDGNEVKVRLLAERQATQSVVHIDWLRFTVQLRNAPAPSVEDLFPKKSDNIWRESTRMAELHRVLATMPDADFAASAQAKDLAAHVAHDLGPDYTVAPEVRKGYDFYRYRWSIERNGVECGWVGYLSSGDSKRQAAQSRTIHANIYGAACTFASNGWSKRLATLIDRTKADITRCDLALDFFDGFPGCPNYLQQTMDDYRAGLCDSAGKTPVSNTQGDWANHRARSFYFGSKEAGKQTNVYEKGHQLFGPESGNPWVRVELRYGNKLRVLPSAMLRRPADFFAGASDWHAAALLAADQAPTPEKVRCTPRLALETVEAEAARSVRWFRDVAAPTCRAAIEFLGFDELLSMVDGAKLPGRLTSFSLPEIRRAFGPAFARIVPQVAGAGHATA